MSRKTPSQDSNSEPNLYYSFEYIFGRDKQTIWQKAERWAAKKSPPYNIILLHIIKALAEWYTGMKVDFEMRKVDDTVERIRSKYGSPETKEYYSQESEVEGLNTIGVRTKQMPGDWNSDVYYERDK